MFLAALAMPAACGKSPTKSPAHEPTTVILSTNSLVLTTVGEQIQITATVLDRDNRIISDAAFLWRSADESTATVDNYGLVTAVSGGATRIIVSSSYAITTATISVEQEAGSVEITPPELTLTYTGQTGQFEAVVKDKGNSLIPDAPVVWSSSHPAVAAVNAAGVVTAVSNGTARISATSGDAYASTAIAVELVAFSMTVTPETATLGSVGATAQFEAEVYDLKGTVIPEIQVAWSSSDQSVATVNADGLVTAVSNGITRISATSGDASANAAIVVDQVTDRIAITPETAALRSVGATVQLEVVVYDMEGSVIPGVQVAWSSSERSIATVNADGVVTAVSNGTAQISATSGEVSANATIVVEQAAFSIAITPETATLKSVGAMVQLEAMVYDKVGAVIPGAQLAWSSSERSVATVNTDGVVTAVSNGTARISATSGDASASATIVVEQTAYSIAITPETATLGSVGENIQFEAAVYDSAEVVIPDAPVTWSSNETGVATVDIAGLATSVGDGTATITARSGESSGTATLTVTLPTPPPPSNTPITPPPSFVDFDFRVYTIFMSYTPVSGSGIPGFVRPGTTIELTPWIVNDGPSSSPSVTVRCYRSSDATITPTDTEVTTFAVPGLSADRTYSKTLSIQVPSSAGTYWYGACANVLAGESNTANNCSHPVRIFVEE